MTTLQAYDATTGKYFDLQVDANGYLKVANQAGTTAIGTVGITPYTTPKAGELAGSATALQMPNIACAIVKFKAVSSNAGNVYIGAAGVTKVDGSTDATTGFELSAGEETGWIPATNLNLFYRICDNAGDDLVYLAMV